MAKKSLRELKAELAVLLPQLEEARAKEAGEALSRVKATVAAFGFSIEDVFGKQKKPTMRVRLEQHLGATADLTGTRQPHLRKRKPRP